MTALALLQQLHELDVALEPYLAWDAALPCPQRRADAGHARRDAPAQTRAACPGGGVVRCRTPSRQSQKNGTTKDRHARMDE